MERKDATGMKSPDGEWVVDGYSHSTKRWDAMFVVRHIACGKTRNMRGTDIRRGDWPRRCMTCMPAKAKSERLYTPEQWRERRHGQTGTKEYFAWNDMKKRCLNPKHPKYHCYGGRGIVICDAWVQSFATFLRDVGPCPDKRLSIDRINNDGNYEPGNVRWATIAQQHASQRHIAGKRRKVA